MGAPLKHDACEWHSYSPVLLAAQTVMICTYKALCMQQPLSHTYTFWAAAVSAVLVTHIFAWPRNREVPKASFSQ